MTLVLGLLLALSNDRSLGALGSRRWKSLHRWTYAGFVLLVVHGVAYQALEKREGAFVALFTGIALVVAGIQLAGYRTMSTRTKAGGPAGRHR